MSPVATMSRGVLPRSRYDEEEDTVLSSVPKEQQAGTVVPIRDWLQRRTTMPEPRAAAEQESLRPLQGFVPIGEWLESRTAMPRPMEQPQEMAPGVPVKAEREIVPKVRPKVWTDPTKYKKDDPYQGLKPWLESSLDPQVDSNLKRMTAMLGEPPTIERNKRIEQYRARTESMLGVKQEVLRGEKEMLPKTPLEHLEPMLREESFSGDVLRTMAGAGVAVAGMGHAITQGLSELPLVEGLIPKKVISWIDTHARELAESSAINSEEIGRQGGISTQVLQTVGEQCLTTAIRLATMRGAGLLQSKSIIANAVKMGLFTAATTPGDAKERVMAGVRTATLMSTPVVSGLMPSTTLAVLLDAGLNIGLSNLYGFYDWKDPKSWIPALVMDVGFAATTRADSGAYDRAIIAGKTYTEAAETVAFPSFRTAGKNLGMTPAEIDKMIADIKALPPVADTEIKTQAETQAKDEVQIEVREVELFQQAKTDSKAPYAEELDRATKDGRSSDAETYRGFIEAIDDARDAQELGQIKAVIDEINTGRKIKQEALSAKPEGAIRDGVGSEADNANKAALSRELGEQRERRAAGEETYEQRMANLEQEGQEVGRPVPVGGPGGQAAEAGRFLPEQRRAEEQRVAEQKVEEVERVKVPSAKPEPIAGTKAVAQRIVNAEDRFIEFAMRQGDLTQEQATKALEAYKKAKAVEIDVIGGQFNLTQGDFANKDVLRRAAGIEAPVSRVKAEAKPPARVETEEIIIEKPVPAEPAVARTRISHFTLPESVSKILQEGYDTSKPPIHAVGGLEGGAKVKKAGGDILYFTTDKDRWSSATIFVGEGKGNISRDVYDYKKQKWVEEKNAYKEIDLSPVEADIKENSNVLSINSYKSALKYLGGMFNRFEFIENLINKARSDGYDIVNVKDPGGAAWEHPQGKTDKNGESNWHNILTGNSGKDDYFILNKENIDFVRPKQAAKPVETEEISIEKPVPKEERAPPPATPLQKDEAVRPVTTTVVGEGAIPSKPTKGLNRNQLIKALSDEGVEIHPLTRKPISELTDDELSRTLAFARDETPPIPKAVLDAEVKQAREQQASIEDAVREEGGIKSYDDGMMSEEIYGVKGRGGLKVGLRAKEGLGQRPDEMVQLLIERGLLPKDATDGDLIRILRESPTKATVEARIKSGESEYGRDTGEEAIDFKWQLNQDKLSKTGELLDSEKMELGDKFTIGGERFEVVEDGFTTITVRDGKELTLTQPYARGEGEKPLEIYIDKNSFSKAGGPAEAKAPELMTYDEKELAFGQGNGPKVGTTFTWSNGAKATITGKSKWKAKTENLDGEFDGYEVVVEGSQYRLPGTKGGAGRTYKQMSISSLLDNGLPYPVKEGDRYVFKPTAEPTRPPIKRAPGELFVEDLALVGETRPDIERQARVQQAAKQAVVERAANLERAAQDLPGIKPVSPEAKAIQQQVDVITEKWVTKPEGGVVVVKSETDLKDLGLSEDSRALVTEGKAEGFYHIPTQRIILISDNIKTPADAARVLLHEGVGHFGLRGVLGADFDTGLLKLGDEIAREDLERVAEAEGVNLDTPEGRLVAIEEYIAKVAQTRNPTLWQKFIVAVREALKGMGISDDVLNTFDSRNEIEKLIDTSRRYVERGVEGAVKPTAAGEREVLLKRPDEKKAKPLAKQPALFAGFDTRSQVSKTVEDTQNRFNVTDDAMKEMSKILTGNADYAKAKISDQVKLIAEIRKQRPARLAGGEVITLKTEHRIDQAVKGMTKRGELTPEYYDDIKAQLETPDPRYVSDRQYATQRDAEELLDRLVNIAPSLKEQIRTDRAELASPAGAEFRALREKAFAARRAEERPEDRKVGMFRKLVDARHFYDFLEEKTGLPFGTLHRTQAEHKHLADATHDKTVTGAMKGIDKSEYKTILTGKESEARISDYITTKLLMGEKLPELPANEKKVADYWIGVLKKWENPVRWLRFTEWRKNPKKYAILDAPESDLEEATRLLEVEGEASARKYLDGKTWGVIESGYAPIEIIRNSILPERQHPGVSKANLQARRALLTTKDSEQSENAIKFDKLEQRNIFQRLISYDRRMNYLINLSSDVEAMDALWKSSADKFDREEGLNDLIKQNMSELLGHREPAGPLERYVFNTYAQAARTIFFDIGKGVRNLFQPEVFQTGWLDLYRAKPLSNERREWMETNVLQNRGITQDFLYSQYPGWSWFRPFNRIVDAVNVMGTTDSINRGRSFRATISRVDRALVKHPKWNDSLSERNKMFKSAALGDLTVTQGKHANDILMTDGTEAFARYVAAAVTQKHQAVYERFQRGLGEQGTEFRRAFSNLFVFPKMLAQRHILDAKKITSLLERQLGKPVGAPGRAAHSIIGTVAMGAVASSLYQLITGSKRRPYDPQQILTGITSFGGLAVGAQQKLGSLASNVLQALQGDEAALSRAMKEIAVVANMFIPFYTQIVRAYEGIGGYNNVDRAILRQIRSALDKRYKARGLEYYERERTLIESGQHAIFGTQIEMPKPKKKYPVGRSALPAARTRAYLKEQSERSQVWRSRMPVAKKRK